MTRLSRNDLTLKQAASLAGLSPITLGVQVRRGRLPARKLGRDWIVTRADLQAYIRHIARRKGATT